MITLVTLPVLRKLHINYCQHQMKHVAMRCSAPNPPTVNKTAGEPVSYPTRHPLHHQRRWFRHKIGMLKYFIIHILEDKHTVPQNRIPSHSQSAAIIPIASNTAPKLSFGRSPATQTCRTANFALSLEIYSAFSNKIRSRRLKPAFQALWY